MSELVPFELEEFFYKYEHEPDLINLASSDALPWRMEELMRRFPEINDVVLKLDLGYPNVKDEVVPRLGYLYGNPVNKTFLPTSGAAEAIYIALSLIHCKKSRNVTIGMPRPAYGAFEGVSKLLGITIEHYLYRREENWAVRDEEILALAKYCDALIVNNPHNPTGQTMSEKLLRNISKEMDNHGGMLIVDEVFLLPDECSTALLLGENVVVLGSLSKVYGLPGLRFGWIAGPSDLIPKMRTLSQYTSLSLSSFAASIGSIVLSKMTEISRHSLLIKNRQILIEWARENTNKVRISIPKGGTTVVLEILTPMEGERRFFKNLLREKVLLVPGNMCFGTNDPIWFRLGYGTRQKELKEGLQRISRAL